MIKDADLKFAMPSEKPYKIYIERGLYLLVTPAGGKYFRYKYRFNSKEKALSIGVYPDVSLDEARKMRNEARRHIDMGLDPMEIVAAEKAKKNETPRHHKKKISELRNGKINLDLSDIGFYNANDVIKILGVSMPFFLLCINQKQVMGIDVPRPIKLSPAVMVWVKSEIHDFINRLINEGQRDE